MVATSSIRPSSAHSLQQAIWSGAFVGTIVPPPATLLLNAPQYATGKVLTDAAIAYINDQARRQGQGRSADAGHDGVSGAAVRGDARRSERSCPASPSSPISRPSPVTKEGGFATMNTILSANPNVDVVLGGDAVVLGALQALRAAGKDRPDQFLGGIDGEPEAVAEIKKGDSPYKASISLSSPVFGYAMGQYAADWLEGKSMPQAMDILPIALTKRQSRAVRGRSGRSGARSIADPARRDTYLKMYGNICYDTRDQYVNFPWSSEAR